MTTQTHKAPAADEINRTGKKRERAKTNGQSCEQAASDLPLKVHLEDFIAYMPERGFIFMPTGQIWPAVNINTRLPQIDICNGSKTIKISPSTWLIRNRPVEQMSWLPGAPPIIRDRLIREGGWISRKGASIFNQYSAPTLQHGDARNAMRWVDLVHRLYPSEADHIFDYFAHRVQRPHEKPNHAIVLGGAQGIGKDTILEGVVQAIGPWNMQSISPGDLLDKFNGYAKAVLLRIVEARDLELNRFQFYETSKHYITAPPDVQRINEKHLRPYYIPNLCGVVLTTNHKTGGLYLPRDDRRHFVGWSEIEREAFSEHFWRDLWAWYHAGGFGHVAAWLAARDLSTFDPKAPPPKTAAFWAIVDANAAPEEAELADAIDVLGRPTVVTLERIVGAVSNNDDFRNWLKDRKNRRQIPFRFEQVGYIPVRNDAANDGLWKVNYRRQAVYGRQELDRRTLLEGARALTVCPSV